MAPSIKDVAKLANISSATVSHVINGTRFVAEETRQRVEAAMRTLNYTPNSLARSLRTNNSKTIALLVSDIANPFFAALIEAVETHLGQHGYNLFLCNSREKPELEQQHLLNMSAQKVRGVILAPTSADKDYRQLFPADYPLVFIDRRTQSLQADTVVVDGVSAMVKAVDALVAKGYKNIGYIGGQVNISTKLERIQGFKNALKNHRLPFRADLEFTGDPNPESGYACAGQLVACGKADAVVVANNPMVLGALKCLMDKNIAIPSQMGIIGFDDYGWASVTTPPLSTVRQPAQALGLKAAQLLLQRFAEPARQWELHQLEADLIVRGSF